MFIFIILNFLKHFYYTKFQDIIIYKYENIIIDNYFKNKLMLRVKIH